MKLETVVPSVREPIGKEPKDKKPTDVLKRDTLFHVCDFHCGSGTEPCPIEPPDFPAGSIRAPRDVSRRNVHQLAALHEVGGFPLALNRKRHKVPTSSSLQYVTLYPNNSERTSFDGDSQDQKLS